MSPTLCIKRSLPLVLVVLAFLCWVIYFHSPPTHTKPVHLEVDALYFHSPPTHTKPVLSLAPLIHPTHSLRSGYLDHVSTRSSLENEENRLNSSILNDNNITFYLTHTGDEIIESSEYAHMTELNMVQVSAGNSVKNEENRLGSAILNDSNTTFYLTHSGIEITNSLEYAQMTELNKFSSLDNVENSENTSIWNHDNMSYHQPKNGNKTTKLVDINRKTIDSHLDSNSSLINDMAMNSLQENVNEYFIYSDPSETYAYDKLNFTSTWSQVLEHRQQRVVEVCRKNSRQLKRIWGYGNLLYDTKHRLAYCRTAKAGTTWWLGSLLLWSGISIIDLSSDEIHLAANQMFPPLDAQHSKQQLDAITFIFMAVRHPFTRLVSAYRDKVINGYRKDLYPEMINSYRKKYEKGSYSRLFDSTKSKTTVPTFREFVLFAAKQVNRCAMVPNSACMLEIDVHWRPAHDRCAPCDVHYDAIIKLETFDSDERYINLITGMPSNKKNKKNGSAQNSQSSKTGHTTEDLTKDYFSTLSPEEVKIIKQAYYYDFLLFDYDSHQYFD